MQFHANLLGTLGLIPFVAIPVAITIGYVGVYEALTFFILYSGVILSFLGGIHWYDSIYRTNSVPQIYIAMLPSLFAWYAIAFISGTSTLIVLMLSHIVVLVYDIIALKMASWYRQLRLALTSVALGCHGAMFWLLNS